MECYYCGKRAQYGHSHTHHRGVAGGRWKKRAQKTNRIFKPNLQIVSIIVAGDTTRVKLCAKCMKRIKKDLGEKKTPFVELAYPPVHAAA